METTNVTEDEYNFSWFNNTLVNTTSATDMQNNTSAVSVQINNPPFLIEKLDFEYFWNYSKPEYLIEHLLPKEKIGILHGNPGDGKSVLVLRMIYSICLGKEFFGRKTKSGKCLYISMEDSKNRIYERLMHFIKNDNLCTFKNKDTDIENMSKNMWLSKLNSNFEYIDLTTKNHNIEDEEYLSNLTEAISKNSYDLIVIDTFRRFASGIDENNSAAISQILNQINVLSENATTLVIHHNNKNNGMRGSSALEGNVRFVLTLESTNNESKVCYLSKNNHGVTGKNSGFTFGLFFDEESGVKYKFIEQDEISGENNKKDAEIFEVLKTFLTETNGILSPSKLYEKIYHKKYNYGRSSQVFIKRIEDLIGVDNLKKINNCKIDNWSGDEIQISGKQYFVSKDVLSRDLINVGVKTSLDQID